MTSPNSSVTLFFHRLSALLTFVTVALGSVVCATRSGFDCHSWPGCYDDRFAPGPADIPAPLVANPAFEMIHRTIAMGTGAVLIVTALLSLRLARELVLPRLLPWVAVVAAGGSALFGRAAVLGLGVDATGAAIDLLCALIAMTVTLVAAVALQRGAGRPSSTPVARPAWAAIGLLVVMHIAAHWAAGHQSFTRCMSWPILWLASDDSFGLQVARTVLAALAFVAVALAVKAALADAEQRTLGLAIGVMLVGVLALATAYRLSGADGGVLGITFSVLSVALLWSLALLAARSAFPAPAASDPVSREPEAAALR